MSDCLDSAKAILEAQTNHGANQVKDIAVGACNATDVSGLTGILNGAAMAGKPPHRINQLKDLIVRARSSPGEGSDRSAKIEGPPGFRSEKGDLMLGNPGFRSEKGVLPSDTGLKCIDKVPGVNMPVCGV